MLDVVRSWVMSNSAQRDTKDTRDESSRAADTDRIQLAQLLAYAAEQGRLQLKDYEDRLARAYAATTYEELDQLRADLPGAPTVRIRGFSLWGGVGVRRKARRPRG